MAITRKFFFVLSLTVIFFPNRIFAASEVSTKFGIYLPSNFNFAQSTPNRAYKLCLTSTSDSNIINYSYETEGVPTSSGSITLQRGESYIFWDGQNKGKYFQIRSRKPIQAMVFAAGTSWWMHNFLPSEGNCVGNNFFYYDALCPRSDGNNKGINIFAFNDNTKIRIYRIDTGPQGIDNAILRVNFQSTTLVDSMTLNSGLTKYLPTTQYQSYWIAANKDISVQYGNLAGSPSSLNTDNGAYVPGSGGTYADTLFYFRCPFGSNDGKELFSIAYDKPAHIQIYGKPNIVGTHDPNTDNYTLLKDTTIQSYDHFDWYADPANTSEYFKVVSSDRIAMFEGNACLYVKGTPYQSNDFGTAITPETGESVGKLFSGIIGGPCRELATDGVTTLTQTHFIVYTNTDATNVEVFDTDNYGEYVELYNPTATAIDLSNWKLTCKRGDIRIPAGKSIGAGQYFLLEYHEKATDSTADYVYGADTYGRTFRMDNAADSIKLLNATNTIVDQVNYGATWNSHGTYKALERTSGATAFTQTNCHDASTLTPTSGNNLGGYYGTPKADNTGFVSGGTNVIITELMTGRIYKTASMNRWRYAKFDFDTTEWEAIHNGTKPNTPSKPETPYLTVRANNRISLVASSFCDDFTYAAPSILPRVPNIQHVSSAYSAQYGDPAVFFMTKVWNDKDITLTGVKTRIIIPKEMDFSPTNYKLPTGYAATVISKVDGGWEINIIHPTPLLPGDQVTFATWATVKQSTSLNFKGIAMESDAICEGYVDIGGGEKDYYSRRDAAIVIEGPYERRMSTTCFTNGALPPDTSIQEYNAIYKNAYVRVYGESRKDVKENMLVEIVSTNGDSEVFMATETGASTGIFDGLIPIGIGTATRMDGTLQIKYLDVLTARYRNPSSWFDISSDQIQVKYDNNPPAVTITAPNGGESWPVASKRKIIWTATNNIGVACVSIYFRTPATSWTKTDSFPASNGNGSYVWTIPSQPTVAAWVKINAYDAAGNKGSDTSDMPFSIVNTPAFTSIDSVAIAPNGNLNYPLTYNNPLGGSVTLEPFSTNPSWPMLVGSIVGTAPNVSRVDTFKVSLSVGGITYDTLKLRIYIGTPSSILPIINIPKSFGLKILGQKVIASIDRPGTLRFKAYDIHGVQVMNYNLGVNAGTYLIPFHPQTGIYLIKLEHEGRKLTKKFLAIE